MPRAGTALKWRPTFYLNTIRRNYEMSVPTGWYHADLDDCIVGGSAQFYDTPDVRRTKEDGSNTRLRHA